MSSRYGVCVNCGEYDSGIYNIDCTRDSLNQIQWWVNDKYNFNVEICEKCLDKITKTWEIDKSSIADKIYVSNRADKVKLIKELGGTDKEIGKLMKYTLDYWDIVNIYKFIKDFNK